MTSAHQKLFWSNPNKFFNLRREEVMEMYFKEADRNKNGKIFTTDLVEILEMNNIKIDDDELLKIGQMANEGGEMTRLDYYQYIKSSPCWDKQLRGRETGAKDLRIAKNLRKRSNVKITFDILDRDDSSGMRRSEFAMISNRLDDKTARNVLAKFASDKNGQISMKDFRELVGQDKMGSKNEEKMEKVLATFKKFDINEDGFITKDEFTKVSRNLSEKQVDAVFARFDTNKDGKLSIEEFKKLIK